MNPKHPTGTRKDWLDRRLELLEAEKAHTRRGDELAEMRQALPWVRVEKDYAFETASGKATLKDLFQGRSQLMIYHFMLGPDFTAGCPSCSGIADSLNAVAAHLANHDVTLGAVSRAPFAKIDAYRKRMGWTFPWASSFASDFNFDFNVAVTPEQQKKGANEYNFRPGRAVTDNAQYPPIVREFAASCGTDAMTYTRDLPGLSTFVMDGGAVYHTYSAYARGLDPLWGMWTWLDRAPFGRNEAGGPFWRRHDEYAAR